MNKKFFLLSKLSLITILLLLFNVNIISQSTYYISSSDGNDSNSGKSSSSPWKNLSKVNATKFYPGDKILFKSGDSWMGQWAIKNSGSSSNPIYIGNFGSGSVPTISGNSSLKYLISFSGDVKYITIDGLYFKDVDPGGGQGLIYGTIENNHIIIENCKFSQSKASQSSTFAMIYMRDANYISIDNCDLTGKSQAMHFRSNNNSNHNDVHHITISNNNFHDIINGGLGRGIRFSSNYDYGVGSSIGAEGIIRDITINDNNFTKLSGQGVYNEDTQNSAGNPIWLAAGETAYNINFLRNTGYLIENCFFDWGRITNRDGKFDWSYVAGNVLDHCGFDVNGNPTTKYPTNGINTHAWKEVYIQDNIISNIANIQGDGKCIVLDHSVDKTKYYCDGVVIRRNILSGVRHSTLEYAAGIHLSKAKNCKIYNNVCYNNKSGISLDLAITTDNFVYNNTLVDNDVGLWFGSGTATGNTVENNIFANNSNCGIHINKYLIYDYNCFYNNGKNYSGGTPGAHDVNGNPKFKDAANHNYQIMSGSAAIDKGVSIAGLNSDILGNAIQNKIDIGAYEYSSSTTQTAPSTPSLNSPSNGSTGISSSPTLNWNSASGAASYNLQVSLNSNFSSNIFSQSGITSTSKQVSGLSDNTKYYWRVNAQNSAGTSSWSSVHYFTTVTIAPPPSSGAYTTFSTDNGTLNGDVRLKTKSGSIGLKVLYFLNTSATAKFNVNLDQSGQWYAWGRMFFESSGSPRSSFYIQVDGGSKLIFGGDNNSFDKWHWEGDGLNKLSLGNLSAGNHTITIYGVPGESGETVMLDQILLTSDADLVASDNLGQETTSGNLIYSADKGSITGDVKLATKSGSLGTKVIYFLNTYSTAKFTVNIDQSGQWYAWGRMFFESSGSPRSSFYLQVDNGPKLTFGGDNNSFDKWHWEGSGLSKLSLGNISAGSHTITIYGRAGESGPTVMLDQILLTSDASLIASDNIGQGSNSGNIVNAANNTILNGDVHLKTKTGSIASKVLYFLNTYSTAKFTINLDKSGQWYAWGRMFFESSGSPRSSFYIQVDNNAKLLFGGDDNSFNKWHWEGNKLNKLSLGNLSSGSHTITIYGVPGETGETVMLDQVLFTSDLAFIPTDNNVFNKSGNDNLNTKQSKTDIPENYTLSQNYPNPFNPSTTIKFSIPQDGLVLLKVYNILGAEVASLVNGNKPAGTYNVTFDASDLSSGVYLYKLITPDFAQTKKMLLVK